MVGNHVTRPCFEVRRERLEATMDADGFLSPSSPRQRTATKELEHVFGGLRQGVDGRVGASKEVEDTKSPWFLNIENSAYSMSYVI